MVQRRKLEKKCAEPARSLNWIRIVQMVLLLCALQWIYPNVIHEPLHLVALYAQDSGGNINFDFSFPAHPSTTRTEELSGVAGALFFYLFPATISVAILLLLWLTRKKGTVWTHFVLPAYLGFDLIINLRTFANPISDFRILLFTPQWVPYVLIFITMIATAAILTSARCGLQELCMLEVFD